MEVRRATTTTIEELPDEVLELVFCYLHLADRKRTRLVCKRWLDVNNSALLTRNDVIVVKRYSDFDKFTTTKSHLNLRLTKSFFYVLRLDEFFRRHGLSVKSIETESGRPLDCSHSDICTIIGLCSNIESLSLGHKCDREREVLENKFGAFKRLSNLEVFPSRINDILIFTNSETKLNRLGFSFFDSEEKVLGVCVPLIERQACNLEQVYLPEGPFFGKNFLNEVIDLLGPQLKGLHIPCQNRALDPENSSKSSYLDFAEDNNSLLKIATKFPNLEELDLTSHSYFSAIDHTINLISALSSLTNLKYICLEDTGIGDEVLLSVAVLQHLRGLDLSYCNFLTADGFLKAFGRAKHSKLLKLRLNYDNWVTDDLLCCILPQFCNLRSLHLERCEITSKGLSGVFNNCKMLTSLSLKNCEQIKSLIKPTSISCLKGLTYLNLEYCFGLKGVSLSVLRLPALQIIDVRNIDLYLTEKLLISLILNCPALETVYLTRKALIINDRNLSRVTGKNCRITIGSCLKKHVSIFDVFEFCRSTFTSHDIYCLKIQLIEPPMRHGEDAVEDGVGTWSLPTFCKCQ